MAVAVAPLFQRSEQQRERLQALYHLAVELSALRDLKSALNTALRHAMETFWKHAGIEPSRDGPRRNLSAARRESEGADPGILSPWR